MFSRFVCSRSAPRFVKQFSALSKGVSVHNEWDPIEEMIVGSALNANWPGKGDKFFELDFANESQKDFPHIKLPYKIPQRIIDETEEDINVFIENVTKIGIKVKRPEQMPSKMIKTFDWEVESYFTYCPRDLHLAIGNTIIECPTGVRCRYLEPLAYHKIMYEYLAEGSRWISAPKGRLTDACFNSDPKDGESLITEHEMMFDAANILRFGRDIIYLVSSTGNELGAKWLQSTLGSDYKVHCARGIYDGIHIDTTIIPLRPGLVMINPNLDPEMLPPIFRKWEVIKGPAMVETKYPAANGLPTMASKWLGLNLLMLSPTLAAVDSNQPALIKLLESRGFDVMPTLLRHGRVLGGGPHCITLDTRRTGTLESYF